MRLPAWACHLCLPPSLADTRRKVLSLVSCFAGGVFLATCLLDLVPDYLASINEALAALRVTVSACDVGGQTRWAQWSLLVWSLYV